MRVSIFVSFYGKCLDGNQILFLLLVESHDMDLDPYVIKGEHDCRATIQLDSGKVQKKCFDFHALKQVQVLGGC